jgi:hypothetical protein
VDTLSHRVLSTAPQASVGNAVIVLSVALVLEQLLDLTLSVPMRIYQASVTPAQAGTHSLNHQQNNFHHTLANVAVIVIYNSTTKS